MSFMPLWPNGLVKETVVEGIENAPKAFLGLFQGENFGKMLVKIGSDPTV